MNAAHSITGPVFLACSRGLNNAMATVKIASISRATHLSAHAKPTGRIRYWTVDAWMTAPKPVPAAESAIASDLFVEKYELRTDSMGMKTRPRPRPVQTPWARKVCQYAAQKLVARVPRTMRNEPAATVCFT